MWYFIGEKCMYKRIILILVLFFNTTAYADDSPVFSMRAEKPMDEVYDSLYKALEEDAFFVVFEVNMGENLARFSQKWGENYNRNQLDGIRSIVFCNGWYANAVSNADPDMLALCPLHVSLYEKAGKTTVVFTRPTVMAANSPALGIAKRIEENVIAVIRKALRGKA
jgi:uncharacterized protein (DUF302 family)